MTVGFQVVLDNKIFNFLNMLRNILSHFFIVKCLETSLLIRVPDSVLLTNNGPKLKNVFSTGIPRELRTFCFHFSACCTLY